MIDVQGGAPQNKQSLMTLSEVLKAVDGRLLSGTLEEIARIVFGQRCRFIYVISVA